MFFVHGAFISNQEVRFPSDEWIEPVKSGSVSVTPDSSSTTGFLRQSTATGASGKTKASVIIPRRALPAFVSLLLNRRTFRSFPKLSKFAAQTSKNIKQLGTADNA